MNLQRLMSYAGALTAAIRREGAILDIDGLRFERRADIVVPTDYVSPMAQGGGRHTMVYELAGTGKQYRVMIEPVPETHR